MDILRLAQDVIDVELVVESAAVAIGFGLTSLFSHIYRKNKSNYEKVSNATKVSIDQELLRAIIDNPNDYQYVAVCGEVQADGRVLQSRYFPDKKGVILNSITEERKEIWEKHSHVWFESGKELSNITDCVPFSLTEGKEMSVHIVDPLESAWCKSSLSVVHKEFREPNNSIFNSIMGFVSGHRVKGYADTERMLQIGTRLLGLGELVTEDGILKLKKPSESEFIITTSSHEDVISHLSRRVTLCRVLRFFLLGATLGGLYIFYKRVQKKYNETLNNRRIQEEIDEVRRQRNRNANNREARIDRVNQEEVCVICLANPRECVILSCGHVCTCVDCVEALPYPRICPMCRAPIVQIVPLFHA